MRKCIFLLIVIFSSISCQNVNVNELEKKITELEKENDDLKLLLENQEELSIIHSNLYGIPQVSDFKVAEKGIINFGFRKNGKIKKYKVYKKNLKTEKLELVFENLTDSQFQLGFTPRSTGDNRIEVVCEFESIKGGTILVPTEIGLNIVN